MSKGSSWKGKEDKPKTSKYPHSGIVSKVFEEAFDKAFTSLEDLVNDQVKLQEKIGAAIKQAESLDNCIYLILQKHLSVLTNIHLIAGIWELQRMKRDYYSHYFKLVELCLKIQAVLTESYAVIRNVTLKTIKAEDGKERLANIYVDQDNISKHLDNLLHHFGRDYKIDWERDKFMPRISDYLSAFIGTLDQHVYAYVSPDSMAKIEAQVLELAKLLPILTELELQLETWY